MKLKRPLSISPISINQFERFKKDWDIMSQENDAVRADLHIETNGAICYVEHHRVKPHLDTKENRNIRMGYNKMPEFSIKSEDDFWKFIAVFVDFNEDF